MTTQNTTPLVTHIEAVLFVAAKPLTFRQLARAVAADEPTVRDAVAALALARNVESSGIHVLQNGDEVQLATSAAAAAYVDAFLAVDLDPELTRPSVETLTIIAYRGPVTKPEIETIRGVNCALILRNLLMRGLITEEDDTVKMQSVYRFSTDALRFFGVHDATELPDYDALHTNAKIAQLLASLAPTSPSV